jgi:hypothetical protein
MRLVDEAPGRGVKLFIVGAGAARISAASSPRTRSCR